MKAAILDAPTATPRYADFAEPPLEAGEVAVRVLAAGLHPLVKGKAMGAHYTSDATYPLIPGVDAVAALPDGQRAYIGWMRPPYGTFAERAAVRPDRVLPLPDGISAEAAAGSLNPASSGWLALRVRARFAAGENVFVLGATGASGQLATKLARTLGAKRVVAAGRNATILARLPSDATIQLDAPDLGEHLRRELRDHGVDIVLDYTWGAPAQAMLAALLAEHETHARRVRFVNIGQVAGTTFALDPQVLRSAPVELLGSGLGSVAVAELVRELPALVGHLATHGLAADIEARPLSDISKAWTQASPDNRRIVFVP